MTHFAIPSSPRRNAGDTDAVFACCFSALHPSPTNEMPRLSHSLNRWALDTYLQVVEALLEAGASPDRANEVDGRQTACMMACAQGRKDVVEALVGCPKKT